MTSKKSLKQTRQEQLLDVFQPTNFKEHVLEFARRLPTSRKGEFEQRLLRRYKKRRRSEEAALFASLRPGTICVDLGANVGKITKRLSDLGCVVHAFEPDPYTFAQLQKNVGDLPDVTLYEAAAGVADGTAILERNSGWSPETLKGSVASSIVPTAERVVHGQTDEVKVIDLVKFLEHLPDRVGFLKIDIEGGEWELVPALLESDVLERVDIMVVEPHERLYPEKEETARAWRAMARGRSKPVMRFDWQ